MHRGQSLYLDGLRLIAALEVFVFHLREVPKVFMISSFWNQLGFEAVIIFFVLSGFVIRHAAGTRDQTVRDFAVSRLTRVYSVAGPALILTFVFDSIGRAIDPNVYAHLHLWGSTLLRLGIGAVMLNEAWVSVQVLSNTPYWSLSYEFWYYVLFGALYYLRGRRRWVVAGVSAVVAGPHILLLFPIWVMGWFAYTERFSHRWPRWILWIAFVQPVVVLALFDHFGVMWKAGHVLESWIGHDLWRNQLAWSRYVMSDLVLGCSIALNLIASKHLGSALERLLLWCAKPIRWSAGWSFTLYLIHIPTLLVLAALLAPVVPEDMRASAIGLSALLIIIAVATVTEGQRDRLKTFIGRILKTSATKSTTVQAEL